jgi:hypothetical protein
MTPLIVTVVAGPAGVLELATTQAGADSCTRSTSGFSSAVSPEESRDGAGGPLSPTELELMQRY